MVAMRMGVFCIAGREAKTRKLRADWLLVGVVQVCFAAKAAVSVVAPTKFCVCGMIYLCLVRALG